MSSPTTSCSGQRELPLHVRGCVLFLNPFINGHTHLDNGLDRWSGIAGKEELEKIPPKRRTVIRQVAQIDDEVASPEAVVQVCGNGGQLHLSGADCDCFFNRALHCKDGRVLPTIASFCQLQDVLLRVDKIAAVARHMHPRLQQFGHSIGLGLDFASCIFDSFFCLFKKRREHFVAA